MREKSTIIKFSNVSTPSGKITPVMNVRGWTFCVRKPVVNSTYPAELGLVKMHEGQSMTFSLKFLSVQVKFNLTLSKRKT